MLRRMRWRFIGAAMAAFFAVMLTLLCFINVWNYCSIARQQDATLQKLWEMDRQEPTSAPAAGALPFEWIEKFSAEVSYMIRFFSVHYNEAGEVVRVNQTYIASVSRAQAVEYADAVLAGGHDRGYYNGYRYLAQPTARGTAVLFLNSEWEIQTMRSLLWIAVAIAGICLVVVFCLVVLFSRQAIAPYLRNLEAQKQFITNASHELKTPLTAISTSADVLAMEYTDNEWVHSIQTQAFRLSKLVTNLITLSRLDEENPFPARTVFSLSDALWEISEPFACRAQAKGVGYVQSIADGLTLNADRAAAQQMVSILLDNAVKYTPEGGEIALAARQSGRRVEITVKNSCSDAAMEDVSRLFERFYRADQAHSSAVSGTGIGLSIAKATAEALGGSISAQRQPGAIVFRIRL